MAADDSNHVHDFETVWNWDLCCYIRKCKTCPASEEIHDEDDNDLGVWGTLGIIVLVFLALMILWVALPDRA